MFLEIEGDTAINLDLIDRIEWKHREKVARLWTGGIVQAESSVAYAYLLQISPEGSVRGHREGMFLNPQDPIRDGSI